MNGERDEGKEGGREEGKERGGRDGGCMLAFIPSAPECSDLFISCSFELRSFNHMQLPRCILFSPYSDMKQTAFTKYEIMVEMCQHCQYRLNARQSEHDGMLPIILRLLSSVRQHSRNLRSIAHSRRSVPHHMVY